MKAIIKIIQRIKCGKCELNSNDNFPCQYGHDKKTCAKRLGEKHGKKN